MPDRVARVIADVFGKSAESIADDDGPHSITEWDSMGHINLWMAIESEFGVSLSPDDATNMLTVSLVRDVLRERGIADLG